MNLLRFAFYEVVYYGPLAWCAFLAITFCAARYVGWIGALLYPALIAAIIVFLDVQWIWDQMQNHPDEGRDADFVFWLGVICRVLFFNALLLPVSFVGLWRRRVTQRKHGPSIRAEQGARANASVRHAACYRMSIEMKPQNEERTEARGAPATGVAHL